MGPSGKCASGFRRTSPWLPSSGPLTSPGNVTSQRIIGDLVVERPHKRCPRTRGRWRIGPATERRCCGVLGGGSPNQRTAATTAAGPERQMRPASDESGVIERRHRGPPDSSRKSVTHQLKPRCHRSSGVGQLGLALCRPRTWLTDQSHEMGDGRPRYILRSRQRSPARDFTRAPRTALRGRAVDKNWCDERPPHCRGTAHRRCVAR